MTKKIHYKETKYGFEYGNAIIKRVASDKKKGWVVLTLETGFFNPDRKENLGIQIYITKRGKVRIYTLKNKPRNPVVEWKEDEDTRRNKRIFLKNETSLMPYV